MEAVPYMAIGAALGALALAAYFANVVLGADEGTERMQEIGAAIREGAMAFLRREYRWVSVFVAGMAVLIFVVLDYGRPWGAIAYVLGAVFSSAAGFVGMTIATQANTRTANAARTGAAVALPLAFRGGAVMGFTVAGLGLFGIAAAYLVFVEILEVDDPFQVVAAFGLGGSSIALFARIGGGIYTKAADVGADLVGKVEAGIPEDDPRNPATIADNVGDNVGDVAGMGADLFESYAGSLVAPIVLASLLFAGIDAEGGVLNLDGLRNLYVVPAPHRRLRHDRLHHRGPPHQGPRERQPRGPAPPGPERGHGTHGGAQLPRRPVGLRRLRRGREAHLPGADDHHRYGRRLGDRLHL